jgi:hypothetical protein
MLLESGGGLRRILSVMNLRRWRWPVLEAVTAVAAALLLTGVSTFVEVDPIGRVGQVSGLAGVQVWSALLAGVLVAGLLIVERVRRGGSRDGLVRLGCAAAAGLATGAVAGGVVVALHGTPYGLWAGQGDYKDLLDWIQRMRAGQPTTDHYPPLFLYALAAYSWLREMPLAFALKDLQIIGTALFGPATYLAWRLLMRPGWALSIGVVASLTVIVPLKPYREIVLVVLLPVIIAFVQHVRSAAAQPGPRGAVRGAALAGALFGVTFGLLFLLYSGWFVWLAPGVAVALAVLAPWRTRWPAILALGGATAAVFVAVSWIHLRGLFSARGGASDAYAYFDTYTEPTFIAMWRDDRPLDLRDGPWPPPGELANVGVFTVLLVVGRGVAIVLGWRRTAVVTLLCGACGAWLVRMLLASRVYADGLVRLYPRTTPVLLCCLLLLAGLGVRYAAATIHRQLPEPQRGALHAVPIGLLLVPLLYFFASAGSATADRYMPDAHLADYGYFAWLAHVTPEPDGGCPPFGQIHGGCTQQPIHVPGSQRRDR